MNKKRLTSRRVRAPGVSSENRELIKNGISAATKMGAAGWVALVSIIALLLAGYAIHAVLAITMKS